MAWRSKLAESSAASDEVTGSMATADSGTKDMVVDGEVDDTGSQSQYQQQ